MDFIKQRHTSTTNDLLHEILDAIDVQNGVQNQYEQFVGFLKPAIGELAINSFYGENTNGIIVKNSSANSIAYVYNFNEYNEINEDRELTGITFPNKRISILPGESWSYLLAVGKKIQTNLWLSTCQNLDLTIFHFQDNNQ
jgi:hypothetical protein